MTNILFHRDAVTLKVLEGLGLFFSVLYLFEAKPESAVSWVLFFVILISYAFIRFCVFNDWYPNTDRSFHLHSPKQERGNKIGIEVHFKKSLVPCVYILFFSSLVALFKIAWLTQALLFFASLLLLSVVSVNIILIYFHLKDKDPLPMNYFSSNQYLKAHEEVTEMA